MVLIPSNSEVHRVSLFNLQLVEGVCMEWFTSQLLTRHYQNLRLSVTPQTSLLLLFGDLSLLTKCKTLSLFKLLSLLKGR